MGYTFWKVLHVTCVAISGCGFVLRGLAVRRNAGWVASRWVRVVPHVVDSTLLGSAVMLALSTHQYPLHDNWLTAKLAGLICYVTLGVFALRGSTRPIRLYAFIGALTALGYIISVALTRNPAPWT